MFKVKRVNKEKIKPIPIPRVDQSKIKGVELFPEIYSNIFLLAKKKSGKTTSINHILKKCIDRDTRVYIFGSTINKDSSWLHIIKTLKERGNAVEAYQSIHDGKDNILSGILQELNIEAEIELMKASEPKKEKLKFICFDDSEDDDEKAECRRKKRKKKISPEVIFIFDDLSTELRDPEVCGLLKKNRHYKSKVLISSQYIHDMKPEAIRQLDYLLVFSGQPEDKLMKLHASLDLSIPFEKFNNLYKHATSEPFCFLYVASTNEMFRKCFRDQYFLS